MTALDDLRALGLTMGGRMAPHTIPVRDPDTGLPTDERLEVQTHVGWTTDRDKADAALALGATVVLYTSRDPECVGFEVSVTLPRAEA